MVVDEKRTSKRVLLTGGRAPATLELARLFHRAGHEVFLAESLPWTVTALSRTVKRRYRVPPPRQEPEAFAYALRDIVRREVIDLVIATCEEIFHLARYRRILDRETTVFTASIEELRKVHSKYLFVETARSLGLAVPETRLLNDKKELLAVVAEGGEKVFKPEYSRFGSQTVVRPTDSKVFENQIIDEKRPWVAQDFVKGKAYATWSVAQNGRLTAHSVYPIGITADGGAAIAFESIDHPEILRWITTFIEGTNFTGQVAFDFIENDHGCFAIECNPRATSGVHLFRSDARVADAFFAPQHPCLTPKGPPSTIFLALWIYGLAGIRSLAGFRRWVRTVCTFRPVLWAWADPLPFLLQGASYMYLVLKAMKHRVSAIIASTMDIEWNGEE